MKLITQHSTTFNEAGGKGKNLLELKQKGLPVPSLVVIPYTQLDAFIGFESKKTTDELKKCITDFSFTQEQLQAIEKELNGAVLFSVRSSAMDEDGEQHSFAGQFESILYVTREEIPSAIKKVWLSAFSDRIAFYRASNNLSHTASISIIIQEMVDAEVSGVAFGIHPVSGNRKHKIISSVYGVGEGLVSGELDADTFEWNGEAFATTLAKKTHRLEKNAGGGTIKTEVTGEKINQASLTETELKQVLEALETCSAFYGKPQDIEFAFQNGKFYLLQSRPVTTLGKIADAGGHRVVWDNSNIIESYPGVTTPLTFSFIIRSYEGAYRLFLEYLGGTQKEIEANADVFANTLGLINGRVYYNLRSWYQMLAMVPGYSINAGFMEKMMGVREKFELPNHQQLSRSSAWYRTVKMLFKMYGRYKSLPRKRKQFKQLLDETIAHYKKIDYTRKNANELMDLYLAFEKKLLNEWKAPLLNDFFAMIWFGMLQKRCGKYGLNKSNVNIHNDLLCGSNDIVSVQPIHRSIAIATFVQENAEIKSWFLSRSDEETWNQLEKGKYPELKKLIDRYISDFGERCIGELKLETISYTQHPPAFVAVVRSYVTNNITSKSTSGKMEEQLRSAAMADVNSVLKWKFYKKYKFNKTLRKAREMVSNRENLRYERTRAFGIVREIFSHLGRTFYAEGVLENKRDVFYLTREEIFNFIRGTAVTTDLKTLVRIRKAEFDAYKKMDTPAERIETFGPVYQGNDFFNTAKVSSIEGDLKGIGCCPGIVKANVQVITDPKSVSSLNGDILVTSSTDPGWVTLFPTASAILVERGSLLSHSAIVAREMGIPCIVGITGLLRTLKSGDEVEMDGSTGQIKLVNKVSE